MKPNFALSLSFEGIGLLHRAFPGWNRVGEVELDSPDLPGALAVLRETAQQINGKDLSSKLVIPNEQIKYLSLDLGLVDEAERTEAILKALDGATPYPVDHLAFDWSLEGKQTQIAAVARETLEEAEKFATDHGFGPVCFVAIPPEGLFSGEPYFGPSSYAEELLGDGSEVQRDMAPIRVTGVVRLPDPGDEVETHPSQTPADPKDVSTLEPEFTEIKSELTSEQDPEQAPAPDGENSAEAIDVTQPVSSEVQDHSSSQGSGLGTETGRAAETLVPSNEEVEDLRTISVLSDTLPSVDDDEAQTQEFAENAHITPELTAEDAEHDSNSEPAFSTIRAERVVSTTASPSLSGVTRSEAPAEGIPAAPAFDSFGERVGVSETPNIEATPEFYDSVTQLERHDEASTAPTLDAEPREKRLSFFSRRGNEMATGLASSVRGTFSSRKMRQAEASEVSAQDVADVRADEESERQRMTIFGARQSERAEAVVGGKPRYLGLVLTAILLVFLAGVAAWASIFMDDGLARLFGPRDPEVALLSPDAPDEMRVEGIEAMVPTAPAPHPTPLETLQTAAVDPKNLPETTKVSPMAEPNLPHALTAKEAQDRYAVTGVWQRAPQSPQLPDQLTLDDLYITSIDPGVDMQDAVALPDIARLDSDIALPRAPVTAKRGARFNLDERGLVVATVDGALSPEGFLVFAGRPPSIPIALPQRNAPTQNADNTAEQSRLSALRPKARPEGLVQENERSNLGGLTKSELARIRPKLRPASAQQLAAELKAEAEAAKQAAAEQAAVEKALVGASAATIPFQNATAQAVATSRKPKSRPRNFSSIVQRAKKSQTSDTGSVTRVAAAVPRNQKTAPRIPSKSSVAKAATVRNQLNLRKVNLIGVYGKPSSRRALVRLANGRYRKVKVGDRIDGGRISSIGDGELRYNKNGRSVILKMPRG